MFTDASDSARVPVVSSVRSRRFQSPVGDAGRHVVGPETALSGPVAIARVRGTIVGGVTVRRRVGQRRLRAVGQHRGTAVQRAQPALPSQVQRIALGQPHRTAAQCCTKQTPRTIITDNDIIYYR